MAERKHRRWRIALGVVALAAGGGGLVLQHLLQPERVSALLVEQARDAGLDLRLHGHASFRYTPHIVVLLPALSLHTGDGGQLLQAQALRVQLPWRTLWSQPLTLDELTIERPVLDLGVLRRWLGARPAGNAPVPDLRLNLRIVDGRLVDGGQVVARGLAASLHNSADLAAWLQRWSPEAPPTHWLPPASATLQAESVDYHDIRIEGLRVQVDDATPARQP